MDITPTKEYLDDLAKRLKRIFDGEYEPMSPGDLFVVLKALNEAIANWRPVAGLTLSELSDAAAQQKSIGADAWAPILATCKLSPKGLARALQDFGKPVYNRYQRGEEIFHALMDAFNLEDRDLAEVSPRPRGFID